MAADEADEVAIAVMGAGEAGRHHAEHITAAPGTRLHSVIDPAEAGAQVAQRFGVPRHESLTRALADGPAPDGIIVATPNQLHLKTGLECIAAGLPTLMEKPLCADVASGERLVAAADAAGVPLLVGHHRRHNPVMQKARELIAGGAIGTPVVANALFWVCKPDEYFDIAWHRQRGAGPIFVNLIHDVDNLRFLLGDVAAVTARESGAIRGNDVEETAVVVLEFVSGVLATASVCDTTVAPWSWEMTTDENPAFPRTDEHCYLIGGTDGALALPSLDIWTGAGGRGWHVPFDLRRPGIRPADPFLRQVSQFARVIRGIEPPLVSGHEGLETLRVIEAVKRSAAGEGRVTL